MRLVLLSDTHSMHERVKVPDGDVVVHAGDWSGRGDVHCMIRFCEWFAMLPHQHRVFIAGNHDWSATHPEVVAKMSDPAWWGPKANAHFLHDTGCEIEGVKFYGSPWQPEFCNWAFNLPRGEALAEKWRAVPAGVDVLVTHGPPQGVMDLVPRGELTGCRDLRRELERIAPALHVFGHIHEGYGAQYRRLGGRRHLAVNASICTGEYRPTNKPIVVDIEPGGEALRFS